LPKPVLLSKSVPEEFPAMYIVPSLETHTELALLDWDHCRSFVHLFRISMPPSQSSKESKAKEALGGSLHFSSLYMLIGILSDPSLPLKFTAPQSD
jgi:hypothetical protein